MTAAYITVQVPSYVRPPFSFPLPTFLPSFFFTTLLPFVPLVLPRKMLTRTLATLAFALFTVSSPLPAGPATYNFKYRITNLQTQKVSTRNELLVFNPTITYPTAGVQWVMGETYTVTWRKLDTVPVVEAILTNSLFCVCAYAETSNFPPEEESKTGLILLGHSGNNSENLDIGALFRCFVVD